MTESTVKLSELARILGVTTRHITDLAAKEVLPKPVKRGEYPLAEVVQAWVKYRVEQVAVPDCQEAGDLYEQKVRLTAAQAHRAEQENRVRDGSLLDAVGVQRVWATYLQGAKSVLESVPVRLAPELAAIDTPEKVHQVLQLAVDEVLQNLGGQLARDLAKKEGYDLDE
jgi:phage terminase Nu1 subunit (DNA packaging protein)